jgi:ATP-dependent DNA helicase HFM1/MER3
MSPIPYSKLAPREYRKLHNLHTSVQKNKSESAVRLSKQKPQFSYASGKEPDLSFLRKSKAVEEDDIFRSRESEGEEFPSPSALAAFLKGDSGDPFQRGNVTYETATPTSTGIEDSLESLEAGMLGLEEPMMRRPSTPKFSSSFANGVFDFDAFDEKNDEPEVFSSQMQDSRKRERSRSPVLPKTKHRRVTNEDPETIPPIRTSEHQESSATSNIPEVESRRDPEEYPQKNTTHNDQQGVQQRSVPAWVDEFDADLIESLMGIVDFVE